MHVFARKKVSLASDRQTLSSNVYNVRGAELYYYNSEDTIFIYKDGPFTFLIADSLENIINAEETKIDFLLITYNYRLMFSIPKDVFNKHSDFSLSFMENKKYGLRLNVGLGYYGITLQSIIVRPNRDWVPKYYPTPSWLH
ncbi:MAG: hypothetical protein EOP52_13965 [Sphingobacteriales bacterium]|nr:MAG: hypothetical protein EOP52_13965 [Sphingobacteriales bacterium]